jgi:hypothetical protein
MNHAEACGVVDVMIEDVRVSEEALDLDRFDDEERAVLLARVREKMRELELFANNGATGPGSLEGTDFMRRYERQQNALTGLLYRLDPEFLEQTTNALADACRDDDE